MQLHIAGSQTGAGSVSVVVRPHGERSHRAGRSRGGNRQLDRHESPGANGMNREVSVRQFIVVLAVALVLGLIASTVVGGAPLP